MKEKLETRLRMLREEFNGGQVQLTEIEKQRAEMDAHAARIKETMLRISGAIQVLEEELAEENGEPAPGASVPESVNG